MTLPFRPRSSALFLTAGALLCASLTGCGAIGSLTAGGEDPSPSASPAPASTSPQKPTDSASPSDSPSSPAASPSSPAASPSESASANSGAARPVSKQEYTDGFVETMRTFTPSQEELKKNGLTQKDMDDMWRCVADKTYDDISDETLQIISNKESEKYATISEEDNTLVENAIDACAIDLVTQ
ncbi:hypothetical protein [Helcobacillus massiliensis]|uniref:hypothetical protein n=1 Tax=Helcobacillus massiliensis TaxID=521392 RepID=UPI002552466D|nr:hypothetical protein [Helcobacillus massiliensis]MDK7741375.1 hypothetical protein [Helcobacillus massiliensis]WOO92778.1 hypothetical protein R3I40_10250 [Helcobacillus massiliensis]